MRDNHCGFLECTLLLKFGHLVKLTEDYPAPRLNVRVFSFRKETPTSRLKGVNKGLSSLYLRCLGIWNNALHHQQGLIQKHTTRNFTLSLHHPPSKSLNKKLVLQSWKINYERMRMDYFKINILIALRLIFKTNKFYM